MRKFVDVARYLLLIAVWLLSATFIISALYYLLSSHPAATIVTPTFLKQFGVLLIVLFVLYYLVNMIYKRVNEE